MVGYAIQYNDSNSDRQRRIEPEWLRILLIHTFFVVCEIHKDRESRKNVVNMYCIDCRRCLCSLCLSDDPFHDRHKTLQIRRYVFQDCVRTADVRRLIDFSGIQEYINNSAKVLLLKAKQPKSAKSTVPRKCRVCHALLVEANQYCSLTCKVSVENNLDFSSPGYQACSMELLDGPEPDSAVDNSDDSPEQSKSSRPLDLAEENEGPRMSFRKRSRKGVPIRSPTH